MKISTQKIHATLRGKGLVSDLYKPSQRIDRTGYNLMTIWKGFYTLTSELYDLEEMANILKEGGVSSIMCENPANGYKFLKIARTQH